MPKYSHDLSPYGDHNADVYREMTIKDALDLATGGGKGVLQKGTMKASIGAGMQGYAKYGVGKLKKEYKGRFGWEAQEYDDQ